MALHVELVALATYNNDVLPVEELGGLLSVFQKRFSSFSLVPVFASQNVFSLAIMPNQDATGQLSQVPLTNELRIRALDLIEGYIAGLKRRQ